MHNIIRRVKEFAVVPNKMYVVRHYLNRILGIEDWQRYYENIFASRIKSHQHPCNKSNLYIVFSVSQNKEAPGGYKYNGGIKLINLWVGLLRKSGYKAVIMTHDGKYENWLLKNQPHISLPELILLKNSGHKIKYVTTWLKSDEFISIADEIYYFDAELAFTSGEHFGILTNLITNNKLRKVGTHSRIIVSWYLEKLKILASYIQEWSDHQVWKVKKKKKRNNIVAYTTESQETAVEISEIEEMCRRSGLKLSFIEVAGTEKEMVNQLGKATYFLGLNHGKDRVWGEGCPRTQQEAMHAGCIVLAYDVLGNHELIHNNINGYLIPNNRSDILATKLIELENNPTLRNEIQNNSLNYATTYLSPNGRIKQIEEFLDLNSTYQEYLINNIEELSYLLKAPVFLTSPEVRAISRYAALSTNNIVEIGAAFGASTSLFVLNARGGIHVDSIDPFIKDSMGTFAASYSKCRSNVKRVLSKYGLLDNLSSWTLHKDYSYTYRKKYKSRIGLLFIDGDHTYEAVKQDFLDWYPLLDSKAFILIHDSCRRPGTKKNDYNMGWQGPTRLAKELEQYKDIILLERISSLSIWQKKQ